MDSHDVIDRPNLGGTAFLGAIYNVRTEKFTSHSIFITSIPEGSIETHPNPEMTSTLHFHNKSSDKLELLNIDTSLKLSFLFGGASVTGSAKYIFDNKSKLKTVQCSFIQKIRTVDDILHWQNKELLKCFNSHFDHEGTHFVIGITWGANTILKLTDEYKDEKSKHEVEQSLKISATKLVEVCSQAVDGSIENKVTYTSKEEISEQNLEIKVYSDLISETIPTTLEEAKVFVKGTKCE